MTIGLDPVLHDFFGIELESDCTSPEIFRSIPDRNWSESMEIFAAFLLLGSYILLIVLDFFWILHVEIYSVCGWFWTEFQRLRTGYGSEIMTMVSPI